MHQGSLVCTFVVGGMEIAVPEDMTNEEAAALFATLPVPSGLSISINEDWIQFNGPTGPHSLSISVSSAERVRLHWYGYVEIATGIKLEKPAAPAAPETKSDLQPGGRVTVHAGGIWRRVKILRVTPKRVQVEFYYKYCYDCRGRLVPGAIPCVRWYKKSEVRS